MNCDIVISIYRLRTKLNCFCYPHKQIVLNMYHKFSEPKLNVQLLLIDNIELISDEQSLADGLIHIIWNRSELEVKVLIDIHLYCCKAVN